METQSTVLNDATSLRKFAAEQVEVLAEELGLAANSPRFLSSDIGLAFAAAKHLNTYRETPARSVAVGTRFCVKYLPQLIASISRNATHLQGQDFTIPYWSRDLVKEKIRDGVCLDLDQRFHALRILCVCARPYAVQYLFLSDGARGGMICIETALERFRRNFLALKEVIEDRVGPMSKHRRVETITNFLDISEYIANFFSCILTTSPAHLREVILPPAMWESFTSQ